MAAVSELPSAVGPPPPPPPVELAVAEELDLVRVDRLVRPFGQQVQKTPPVSNLVAREGAGNPLHGFAECAGLGLLRRASLAGTAQAETALIGVASAGRDSGNAQFRRIDMQPRIGVVGNALQPSDDTADGADQVTITVQGFLRPYGPQTAAVA